MGASCPWAIASTDYVVRVTSEEGKIGRGHLSRFQDPEEPIPVIVTPDGTLWVSTKEDGVSHFDGQTWTTYTEEDGLASNTGEGLRPLCRCGL
jgi:ligand-binding sensor domain-containing protein